MPPVAHIVGEIFPTVGRAGMVFVAAIIFTAWVTMWREAVARRRTRAQRIVRAVMFNIHGRRHLRQTIDSIAPETYTDMIATLEAIVEKELRQ